MKLLNNFLETEVIIKSQALDALSSMYSKTYKMNSYVGVKFRATIKRTHKPNTDKYEFPIIANGDAQSAKEVLEYLRDKGAITQRQHTLLSTAFELAEAYSTV